jgi:hypothetical protein
MRYVFGFILFVVALGVVGCGDKCSRPLSDYCSGAECPTFEETVADIAWLPDTIEACGDTRLIWGEVNFETRSIRYFDDSGALVAADDCDWHDEGCRITLYGPVPSCPEVSRGHLCPY